MKASEIDADQAAAAAQQARINALPPVQQAAEIRRVAAEAHAAYPQYAGHWDTWQLVTIGQRVRTKLGVAFEPGDVTVGLPYRPHGECVVYSIRNACNTVLSTGVQRMPAPRVRITDDGESIECPISEAIDANRDAPDIVEILEHLCAGDTHVVGGGAATAMTIEGIS